MRKRVSLGTERGGAKVERDKNSIGLGSEKVGKDEETNDCSLGSARRDRRPLRGIGEHRRLKQEFLHFTQ